jgi:hypothetical protein
MKGYTILKIKSPKLKIEGNMIKCSSHTIQISQISRLWAGPTPKQPLPVMLLILVSLAALTGLNFIHSILIILIYSLILLAVLLKHAIQSEEQSINIELSSGEIYCFSAEDTEFVLQVYNHINDIIAGKETEADLDINLSTGTITDNHKIEIEAETQVVSKAKRKAPSNKEIQTLLDYVKGKEEVDTEAVAIIEELSDKLDSGNRDGIKDILSKFISKGLINDCNELELNGLVDIVKQNIYG